MKTQAKSTSREVFLLALLAAALIYLPFIVYNGGYFIYYGDFNVQQIPFYQLAHEAVRSGDIFWSWYTDLGANFIGSYSFYLLFSPFFWLTLPFPTSWVPFLMGPLLMLKTACAALTAFLYLRRFVRNEDYAKIGAMLYAFSGWMLFNVFFNHFLDVAVFFPLLLLGVEQLVTENRRGFFAAMVLLGAVVNYWFFVGEAIFVVIYVLLRATDREWGLTPKKFAAIAVEAVLGFGVAAVVVLPSVLALLGNPRVGGEEMLQGWGMWLYSNSQRYAGIVQSMFFPPEAVARPNFLPGHGAKWASLSAWLPLFSATGVVAYFFRRRGDWLKKILAFSFLCAMVPLLNNMFVLFNHSYYARWFYMPVLLMALATARTLEDADPALGSQAAVDYRRSIKWTAIVLLVFTVMCGLTPYIEEGELTIGLADNPPLMWIYAAVAFVCLAGTAALVLVLRRNPRFARIALAGVLVVSVGFSVFYIANGKNRKTRDDDLIQYAIQGRSRIQLPETDGFARVDFYDALDNLGMYWHVPTIQAFHSIVPPSIMEFYPQVGVTRDVGSRPDAELYALRPLLSVKWLFVEEGKTEDVPLPDFQFHSVQDGYILFENLNYLPLGFAYDRVLTMDELEDFSELNRSHAMLRAVVLDDDAVARNSDILSPLDNEGFLHLNERTMEEDVDARRAMKSESVSIDRTGFTVTTNYDKERLLFVSVPYESGWSANMTAADGAVRQARIERANIGFMAVRVPPGLQTVRFSYSTPGLTIGLIITGAFLLLLALYILRARRGGVKPDGDAGLPDGDGTAGEAQKPEKAKKRDKKSEKKPKEKRKGKKADDEPSPEPGEPSPEPGEPSPEPGEPSPEPGEPSPEPGEPSPGPGEPSPEPGEPSPGPGEPSPEPGEPSPGPGEPSPGPGEPSPEPGEPSPEPDKPSPEPDEPSPEPGEPSPEPGEPSPEPGEPSPEPEASAAVESDSTQEPDEQPDLYFKAMPAAEEAQPAENAEIAEELSPEADPLSAEPQTEEDHGQPDASMTEDGSEPSLQDAQPVEEEKADGSAPAAERKEPPQPKPAGLKRDARLRGAQRGSSRPTRRDPRTGKPVAGPRRDPRTGKPLPPRDPKAPPKP